MPLDFFGKSRKEGKKQVMHIVKENDIMNV